MSSGLAFHRWLALLAAPLIVVAAATALALNHQDRIYAPPAETQATTPFGAYMLCAWADPTDGRRLLVGTAKGLFRSDDGGRTWAVVGRHSQVIALAQAGGQLLMAERAGGLHRSADGGRTWAPEPGPAKDVALHGLAVSGGQLLVLAADGMYQRSGAGWRRVAAQPAAGAEAPGRAAVRVLYDLHDGRFWGAWGVWLTDACALAILALAASGFGTWARRLWRIRHPRRGLSRPGAPGW